MGVSHFSAVAPTFSVLALGTVAADKTLTTQEAQDVGILTATPSANKSVIFPKAIEGKVLIVSNEASATHTLTVKVGADGTGVAVAAAKSAILRCTGTDFVRVTADA
jgi:hypothetical protein